MSASSITLSRPAADLAVLTFDLPGKGANVLSPAVLDELSQHLDALEKDAGLAGLIVRSGKPGTFIAGADLREFVASFDAPKEQVVAMCRKGQTLFGRLSKCPFVTVAAIDGICVGGGAELAIWCDRRVMSNNPKTEFGFPEVKLGLFPGWGGTVRAPRIIGLANAVELITGGESVDARAAAALGLADDVCPPEKLLDAAIAMVRAEQVSKQYVRDRAKWSEPIAANETELGFLGATAQAMIQQQTKGQYPAPEAALNLMLESALQDSQAALVREAEGMADLFGSEVNRSLVSLFFLTDRNKKDTGLEGEKAKSTAPRDIRSVAVIGAGIMGAGIAAATLKREIPTAIADANGDALRRGARQAVEEAAYSKSAKGSDPARLLALAPLMALAEDDHAFKNRDLVIEAVVENADVKRALYARVEPLLADSAILASNTSTIPITFLAEKLAHPERFCGIHFFNPVRRMKLVEVIRGKRTSDETIVTAVAYAKKVGKSPIVVNDGPGFLVNRLLFPYMNEALNLVSEGATLEEVDRASKKFGMPMGPITLYDVVGLDTALYAGGVMKKAFPDRITDTPILDAMVKAGRLGQKNGLGFFSYKNKKQRAEPDSAVATLLAPYIKGERKGDKKFSTDELIHRLFLPMLLEATRVLEDGIVRDARDVDLGLIFGLGFPPFKGGLLFWADRVGAAKLIEMLKPYEHLGPRFQPTPLLVEMAKSNKKFYS